MFFEESVLAQDKTSLLLKQRLSMINIHNLQSLQYENKVN
jgi:hypothetical protein